MNIRRPRPLPRQGRRLGPPEVWNLALGSQAKAHAIKATPLSATCPRHLHAPAELLHLHAPGRSRLPFARPQTLQTLPQASKATTLTATACPCHLFFRGFKTAVCPPSNPPSASNALAGLQGNNSYSYMPLPSVFQGVQDCRLPALKPPKRFQRSRRPPRQQLLQLHVLKPSKRFQPSRRPPRPCHLFFRGSRLPFARPQTPQTLPTLPQASKATTLTATCPQTLQTLPTLSQASKATTLTATCPCHLFFRGFKTAVCPPSNPPNASNALAGLQGNNSYSYMSDAPAGLQGNNSYSYMPLPSVFQGVQDCRLPGPKPPKRFQPSRRPPRQQLLQLLHAPAICFSGGSRLPFARPQTPQTLPTLPQASKATTLTATCPCHLFFRGFKTAVASTATCPCHLFFRGFKTAVCLPSNPPNASNAPAGLQGNNSYSYMSCHLFFRGFKTAVASKGTRNVCPASNPPNASARLQGNNSYSYYMPLPSVFQGVQGSKATTLTATCPQTLQTLPTLSQASKATTLTATCPCHLFFTGFKTAVCPPSNPPNASNALAGLQGNNSYSYMSNAPAGLQGNNSYSYMPLPSVFQGVQDCRLPGPKPPKRFQPSRRPPRQQLLQLHAPAICFSGGSRLPFARPQTPQTLPTLPQASKATTLTATCPCHLFFRGFKTAVASTATCPCHLFFRGFKTAVCPASNPPNASSPPAGLQGNNSYSYCMPLPSVFQGVQDCRLPALKPPNASNAPAGLQGNNSYSYMSLPSVFQGVQDCRRKQRHTQRLPGLKPSKRFCTPPRQQLLQLLHAPAICFSRGSRLPFARPQTSQTLPTLPQASKATTLTATCPCHLFFRGFKTAVCPPSNPPNASNAPAGLQGNNSYSYMPLPSVFQGVQDCRLPALKPPKRFQRSRRPPKATTLTATCPCHLFFRGFKTTRRKQRHTQRLPGLKPSQTLLHASKATTLTATTCPCHLFFTGFKTAVCPASNVPNASNAPAGLQGNNSYSYMPLPSVFQGFKTAVCPPSNPPNASNAPAGLQGNNSYRLHVPAICFSGGSRLPSQAKAHATFARPQTLQTLLHAFQGNNSYSYYMPLPSVFQGVQDCRLSVWGFGLPFARPQTSQTLPTLPQASKATTLTAPTCPCQSVFQGVQDCRLPAFKPPNASNPPAGRQGNNSYSYMPLPSVFQGVQDCRLPALKPPNASNAPAGLQGNNSCSYMSLPSVFQGVQDCRLLGLKPPKRFQPSRRPPRQQLLQLHAPAICFSGVQDCRLPASNPPNASNPPGVEQIGVVSQRRRGRRHPGASPFYLKSIKIPILIDWFMIFMIIHESKFKSTTTFPYLNPHNNARLTYSHWPWQKYEVKSRTP